MQGVGVVAAGGGGVVWVQGGTSRGMRGTRGTAVAAVQLVSGGREERGGGRWRGGGGGGGGRGWSGAGTRGSAAAGWRGSGAGQGAGGRDRRRGGGVGPQSARAAPLASCGRQDAGALTTSPQAGPRGPGWRYADPGPGRRRALAVGRGRGAAPAFTPGARYPRPGALALPPLARPARTRPRTGGADGSTAWRSAVGWVHGAARGTRRGAARSPDALRLAYRPDQTIRRSSPSSPPPASRGPAAGAGPPPRRASPDTLGFLYIDGHTRAYFGSGTSRRCT